MTHPSRLPVLTPGTVIETARCTGHCCKRFTLQASPEHLQKMYDQWIAMGRPAGHDIAKVQPMVIYLGFTDEGPGGERVSEPYHYYTCKHFEVETGNCLNYENRPRMCSEYPYGGVCKYKGCTQQMACVEGPLEAPPNKPLWLDGLLAETKASLKESYESEPFDAGEPL